VLDAGRPWDLYSSAKRTSFLCVLFLVGTSNYIDRNIIGVLLEPIKAEFRVSDTMLGLLTGLSFALLYATVGIPVAQWADRGDRKLVITLSLGVWSLATTLCGLATTFTQLLFARVGVGAGEAGAVPPAHSLLADYYSPQKRARAIGIFTASSSAGYGVGLALGGYITQHYGWRAAFIAVGSFGMALLPLTHFLLREPRKLSEFATRAAHRESVISAMRALLARRTIRHILGAVIVYFLMAYGALVFIVSLLIRAHELSVVQAGTTFGAISAAGAMVGSIGGGAVADRLAARDLSWLARLSGWLLIAAMPFYELALWCPDIWPMSVLLFVATVLLASAVPSMFSALHAVCGSKRRALAVAAAFFFANLIGLGLGPVIVGVLSDHLGTLYGVAAGLRYALMIVMPILLPAGLLMLRAARTLEMDAED
jgi:predicted MFS family arabinose efflux permease